MTDGKRPLYVLAGQQNCGKSTLFNALTGLKQHIANYPGVTVDKKSGVYSHHGQQVELVDLPGTYSLTSYSLEERVTRQYLLEQSPNLIINVLDASNLERGLSLSLQLMELGAPMLVVLNMMDVAKRHGLSFDLAVLERQLGVPVIAIIGKKHRDIERLREKIAQAATQTSAAHLPVYGEHADAIAHLSAELATRTALPATLRRFTALKLLEQDKQAQEYLKKEYPEASKAIFALVHQMMNKQDENESFAEAFMRLRAEHASSICALSLRKMEEKVYYSERIDRLLLHRFFAPIFLVFTIWLIYQLSIVQGYALTQYTWPFLAAWRNFVNDLLPFAGFLYDSPFRSITLWMVDSANTLLNYIPIFLILFALIAILEDSGYMARIAFILDRILHRFGLHGQSTLPFILAGVFAGGCAVPGVMATKGIPDQRARMATILTVPFMNCLAKVPLYTLLVNIYFQGHKGLILFYISTMTIIAALLISKLLSVSVLRKTETAPFVMELPHYHLPGIGSVLRRSLDRTWLYIKKVGTIVVAVATVVYVLLQYPGLSNEQKTHYETQAEQSIQRFYNSMQGNPYLEAVNQPKDLLALLNVYNNYKAERLNSKNTDSLTARYQKRHPQFYPFLRTGKLDGENRKAINALRQLDRERKNYRREMKELRIENSILGRIGRGLEPITRFADFDWKINVALLSSFAARESSVATLGVLFSPNDDENLPLEQRMGSEQKESGHSALSAVALILFFALYPPCLATTIMIRVQTGSYRWMIFSMIFPTLLGLLVASLAYSLGSTLALSGVATFSLIYFSALALLILVGLYKKPLGMHLCTPPYHA